MIKELTKFVIEIPDLVRERTTEPKAGLHILIRFDEDGNATLVNSERYRGKKHGETSAFLKECASRQEVAWMINTNKCFDLPSKGIHSASPYCFAFKRESWIGGEKYPKDSNKPDILERSVSYFEKCSGMKYGLDETHKQKALQFRKYLETEMHKLLEVSGTYNDLDSSDYIIIYTDEPLEKYKFFNDRYVSEGLFNTADYNIELDGKVHGTSNFHNGFNSKKPFLTHQTASFDITSRISAFEAKALSDFTNMAGKRLFPNPVPIFIDQPELTKEAIKIYHKEEGKKSTHREIISELLKRKMDLGNYYLLYYSAGAIQDFDFVAKFHYLLSETSNAEPNSWVIENVTEIKEKDKSLKKSIEVTTVFDFERIVVRQLFDNALIKVDEKKGEISLRYFDEMDPKYYRPALFTRLLRYRKSIYDFIYKSMRSAIGRKQFQDICMTGMLDDLKENKEFAIKAKLNIYFSLHKYFDKNENPQIMPSKIEEHKTLLSRVVDEASVHFTTDEAYAFGAGQLIFYLLSQSEAGERTHAVLEPFIQKTNNAHFNEAVAAILLKYKHAIGFDFKRFNQLAAEVLDYTPEKGLQELRPFLLAGYFCPNVLYTKKSDLPS